MRHWVKSERYQLKVSENKEDFGVGFYDPYDEYGKEAYLK